jgi:hypothetical protein
MNEISIPMNAVRVCNAISRIGYEPHSAIMDIVDNSVAAGALNVVINISLVDGKTINQRNNVSSYVIFDDGKGMNESEIVNAFKLGSDANYSKNSLSKYGMGLKSAGFSLGTKIQIVSRVNNQFSNKYILDRAVIEARNDYVVCCEELSNSEIDNYVHLFEGSPSGTIVEITGCGSIYHTSARTTIDKLKHRLGVTYFPFLSRPDGSRLTIKLKLPDNELYIVPPVDILFTQDAETGFDPTTYSSYKPCYAFKDEWKLPMLGEQLEAAIKLEVMTFPKDAMAGPTSPLTDNEKNKIRSYKISRENKGFFIYRNGRLIRWGDNLDDIVGKDLIGLRARMELTTAHDDLLHVDVSKQRLEMDDETRKDLDRLMRLPRKQAKQIFELCDGKLTSVNSEGSVFSATTDSVPEEDPIEDSSPPDPTEKKKRAKKKEEEGKSVLKLTEQENSENPDCNDVTSECNDIFKHVRYSDDLPGMNLWSTQKDAIQGSFVIINRRHPFYQTIISYFEDSSPQRLSLEAVIYCCAVGENKAYENLTMVTEGDIRKVLDRYHTVLSYNLGEWSNGNQHLFEK